MEQSNIATKSEAASADSNTAETRSIPSGALRGWLLYDEECGFCTSRVASITPLLCRNGFATAPLGSAFARERLQLGEPELRREVRLLLADGTLFEGSEAYRQLLRRISWARPLYLLVSLPGMRTAFDWGYRLVARHRGRLLGGCAAEHLEV
jgi:predicted DCC family thiol-disulfide oxidoreductase YuxK